MGMQHTLRILLVSLLCMGSFACASVAPSLSRNELLEEAPLTEYRLGAGDRVSVIVFRHDDLSGAFSVDGSGQVSLPLIGALQAQGLTVRELELVIEERLRGDYLNRPDVSVEVLTYRPFYILGEVNEPGNYPYVDGLTVVNAVAMASGYTYRADRNRVMLQRAGETQETPYSISATSPVMPGDTIRIPERLF